MNSSCNSHTSWQQEHLAAAATLAYLSNATQSIGRSQGLDHLPLRQPEKLEESPGPAPSSTPNTCFPGMRKSFPMKLFEVLQTNQHFDILRWVPSGKAFVILDKTRFTNEILPKYFKKAQYASFARKLSRWQFERISKGPFAGAYYNNFFRRDMKKLCVLISCDGLVHVDIPRLVNADNVPLPILDEIVTHVARPRRNPQPVPLKRQDCFLSNGSSREVHTDRLLPYVESKRSRIVQLEQEQQWHRNNFIHHMKAQQPKGQYYNPGIAVNSFQSADTIIAEAKKVLEVSHILESNYSQGKNSAIIRGILNPAAVASNIRFQLRDLMSLQNKIHPNAQYNVATNRSLQAPIDVKNHRASAA